MNIKEEEILHLALHQLAEYLGKSDTVSAIGEDLVLILGSQFICEVRPSLDRSSYNIAAAALKDKAINANLSPLLICGYATDEMFSVAKADGIHILDAAGNCEITPIGGPFLSIRGRKSEFRKQPTGMVFRTAGIKVLYYLLMDPLNIRKSIREIQANTGVSVGTVKNVIDALTPQFCFESSQGRNLKDLPSLLDFWAQEFNQLLKPRLLVSHLEFPRGKSQEWQKVTLPDGMNWGGECGAFLLDGYLIPERFELYTKVPTSALLKTGKVVPAAEGQINVYEQFWMQPQTGIHPLVLYADLMGTADGRCREQAKRLLNNELSYIK